MTLCGSKVGETLAWRWANALSQLEELTNRRDRLLTDTSELQRNIAETHQSLKRLRHLRRRLEHLVAAAVLCAAAVAGLFWIAKGA